ncbi:MAG: hypothetical protein ABIP06_01405 [Pyrinomonadaceae bacterium]
MEFEKNLSGLNQNYFMFSKIAGKNQKGSAIVIALLVMVLLLGFVALAISRTNSETIASANDTSETKTFEAAHASLEVMTKNFDKIFDIKLNPNKGDLDRVQSQNPPEFDEYDFDQNILQTQKTKQVVMTGGVFQGLNAIRDEWQLTTAATEKNSGVEVALRRRFFNNRIPIFQFGIFYDDDLEFHPGPRFDFGGRVHANGSMFLMAQTGLYFSSKVTAKGHIFTDVAKNGSPWTNWNQNVFIKNASGNYIQLNHEMGSVLQNPANGTPVTSNPYYPTTYENSSWSSNSNLFQGNLIIVPKPLELPIKINSNINGTQLDYFELLKRGKDAGSLYNDGTGTVSTPKVLPVTTAAADDEVTAKERYYNKTGIRISLADSKAKLPGCASGVGQTPVTTVCGIRLDGSQDGQGANPGAGASRGYTPRPMTDSYQATRINGERFYTGREVWIKIETVGYNPATNLYETRDITEDILSFGITEPAPTITQSSTTVFSLIGYGSRDSRSIVKLQRFLFGGSKLNSTDSNYFTASTWNSIDYNYVQAAKQASGDPSAVRVDNGSSGFFSGDHQDHWKRAVITNTSEDRWVVPFPINMFDTREGLYYDGTAFNTGTAYGKKVPWNGVMSMVDIDVGNLKAFFDGFYDSKTPSGTPFATTAGRTLRGSDIPEANGWVLYVSDRRGDYDFDGEYDMEDIYGNNDGVLQAGEDINNNNRLDADYGNEAVKYNGFGAAEQPEIAAVLEHKFYRRGVRLVNGTKLPGNYSSTNPLNTRGFTVASENGVYVLGNYNATGIANIGTPTKSTDYLPQNTADHIPASIAADAVTILSNSWSDARSFTFPFTQSNRAASETTVRFAMLAGDTKSSLNGTPNQGGGDPRLSGGVHNFKRFLENWSGKRLNYAGSLINLFNSHNNNGSYKSGSTVYSPPNRNWVFDTTFLDPNRLPPGTPFFQSIQLTGFQRLN